MPEVHKKRRRWPWVIAAATLLLVVAVFGWRYRPLSSAEQRFIGRWESRVISHGNSAETVVGEELILWGNRRFTRRDVFTLGTPIENYGDWEATSETLVLKPDAPFWLSDRFSWVFGRRGPPLNRKWSIDPTGNVLWPEIALLERQWDRVGDR